jgi:multidrug efflux system outer membrane protein
MRHRITVFIYLLLASLIVSSCNFSPKYTRDLSLFFNKKEYISPLSQKMSVAELTNWWDRLNDSMTSKLVRQLLKQNLTLKEASERVVQAKEFASIQGATRFPSVSLENGASRRFANVTSPADGSSNKVYSGNYSTNLGVSWQLDLFGKLKSAKDSATATALAAEYDLQGITQTLIAELVNRRVSIYLNHRLLQLARENNKNAKKLYLSIKKRYELGTGNIKLSAFYLAKENFESSKKDIYQFRKIMADEMYKLDVLLAQTPGTIRKVDLVQRVQLPETLNVVGVPLQLLDRRPDLKSAEIKIEAANADIGVAVSDLFPNLFFDSGVGYGSASSKNLFISDNMSVFILGQITTKIFAGGALRSNVKIQESKARELSAAYARKILVAIQEVESNLKAENENMLNYESQKTSLKLFERSDKQINIRYIRGIESLNRLLESRTRSYNSHKSLITAEHILWQSRIALYLSLGGDWRAKN